MGYKKLLLEKQGAVARITLNRPEALNAIDEELLNELVAACGEVENDAEVRVVILSGAGRAFSAGRDLKDIKAGRSKRGGPRFMALEELSKPVIAAVQGACYTGAFELVMCADIVIASEDAVFADTHARYGIVPGGGATQRLPRRVGSHRAKEILFTCEPLPAREAERIGIVNRVVPVDRLQAAAQEMAEKIAKNVPESIRRMKALINKGMRMDLGSGLEMEGLAHPGTVLASGQGEGRLTDFLEKKRGV